MCWAGTSCFIVPVIGRKYTKIDQGQNRLSSDDRKGARTGIEVNRFMDDFLFSKYDIFRVLEGHKLAIGDAVQKLETNYLLNANEDDLVESFVDEFRLDVPVLKEHEIHIADHGETKVDVSEDPTKFLRDRSQPFFIPGTRTVIAIPFDGDA